MNQQLNKWSRGADGRLESRDSGDTPKLTFINTNLPSATIIGTQSSPLITPTSTVFIWSPAAVSKTTNIVTTTSARTTVTSSLKTSISKSASKDTTSTTVSTNQPSYCYSGSGGSVSISYPSSSSSNSTNSSSSSLLVSNNDDDDDMNINNLMPEIFHGLSTGDADNWLKDVEHWCAFRKLDDRGCLGVIPLLMKDGARHWFETLGERYKDTLEHFSEAFRDHYRRDATNSWKDTAAVWNTIQQPGQSVETFISNIEQKALKANITEAQLKDCILSGLRQEVRQMVVQHEPKSIPEVRKWAIIAEASCDRAEITNPDLTSMIRRLEEKVDKMQVRQIAPPRSPSPAPRVRFSNNQQTYNSGDDGDRRNWNQANTPYASTPYLQRSTSPGFNQMYRQGGRPATPYQGLPRRSGPFDSRQPINQQQAWANQNQGRQTCFNCGGGRHPMTSCPARSITCFNCGKGGHYSRLCRQARRNQQ